MVRCWSVETEEPDHVQMVFPRRGAHNQRPRIAGPLFCGCEVVRQAARNMKAQMDAYDVGSDNRRKSRITNLLRIFIVPIVNVANFLLVATKIYAAVVSRSFSITTSALDSFGDVFVGVLIIVVTVWNPKSKPQKYPKGCNPDSLITVIASSIMLILGAMDVFTHADRYYSGKAENNVSVQDLILIFINIVVKVFLALLCKLESDDQQIDMLFRDQRTDVFTNAIAFVVSFLILQWQIKWIDVAGAIVILFCIYLNWVPQLLEHFHKLCGVVPDRKDVNAIRKTAQASGLIYTNNIRIVAHHFGEPIVVELYCTLHRDNTPIHVILDKLRQHILAAHKEIHLLSIILIPLHANNNHFRPEPRLRILANKTTRKVVEERMNLLINEYNQRHSVDDLDIEANNNDGDDVVTDTLLATIATEETITVSLQETNETPKQEEDRDDDTQELNEEHNAQQEIAINMSEQQEAVLVDTVAEVTETGDTPTVDEADQADPAPDVSAVDDVAVDDSAVADSGGDAGGDGDQ